MAPRTLTHRCRLEAFSASTEGSQVLPKSIRLRFAWMVTPLLQLDIAYIRKFLASKKLSSRASLNSRMNSGTGQRQY